MRYSENTIQQYDQAGALDMNVNVPPASELIVQGRNSRRKPGLIQRLKSVLRLGVNSVAVERGEFAALVQQVFVAKGARCVVFCGVDDAQGSRYIARQAAIALAGRVSGRVCLVISSIPGEVRFKPWISAVQQRGIQGAPFKLSEAPLYEVAADAAGAQNIEALRLRIEELRKEFDYVLVNTPPICVSCEAGMFAHFSDGVVLVVEANSTRRVAAMKACESLATAKGKLLGVVLNNRTFPIPESLYRRL